MNINVYSSVKNIPDLRDGLPILCYPNKTGNPHEIEYCFNLKKIHIMANQDGLFISRKPTLLERIKNKLKRKNK